MITKKWFCLPAFLVIAAIAIGQDNVKVNNKPEKKEKGGAKDNPAIRKSKKEMDAQSKQFDKKKYDRDVMPGRKKSGGENKDDKQDKKSTKKEEKKNL